MTSPAATRNGQRTHDDAAHDDAGTSIPSSTGRRVPLGILVALAMFTGLVTTLVLVLVAFAGAGEAVITGSGLVGLATGWALLALLSDRLAGRPQRWAAVPAVAMAATGAVLLALRPGDPVLTAAAWVWPPAALALAVWMVRAIRRAMISRTGWLLYPVIGALAVTAVGGLVENVAMARDQGRYPMPGALYDVGGHRLHLLCTGTGSPTVVLENGLSEISTLWNGVIAQVAPTTRICAYDRAGQGRSDDVDHPQDGLAVAADLHTLLAAAGEPGPYVLAGHSSGGTLALTYAARYPADIAGLVLLDSSSPYQFTDQPAFPGTYALMHRALPLLPSLARLGVLRVAPPSTSTALTPEAAAQVRAFATSPRGAAAMRDEQSQLRNVFTQAQALTSLSPEPLAVVTARENAEGTPGWSAAQDRMATLSTNSTHWTADTTHVGLLDDAAGAADSVSAITMVVTAARTGTPLPPR